MKIAVSTDEYTHLVALLREELERRGHEVRYFGPAQDGESADWPDVTLEAVSSVKDGSVDEAIVLCWTGTGCSMAANKIPGIRAALCHDAETAKGARIWNHANVLAMSLRATSDAVLKEILDVWFATTYSEDSWNQEQIDKLNRIERLGRIGNAE